jgi:hypothetical protein
VRCATHAAACGLCGATMCDACTHTGGCRLCGDAVCEACMRTCHSSRAGVGCDERACAGCFVKCGRCGADADAAGTTCEAPGCAAECDYCGLHMCGACHADARCGCPDADGRPLRCGNTGGAGGDACGNDTCAGCGKTVCEKCGPADGCENCGRPTNLCAACAGVALACGHSNVCLLCRIVCEHDKFYVDGPCTAVECASCWKACSGCDITLCSTHAVACGVCLGSWSCMRHLEFEGNGVNMLCAECNRGMCARCKPVGCNCEASRHEACLPADHQLAECATCHTVLCDDCWFTKAEPRVGDATDGEPNGLVYCSTHRW